MTKKKFFYEVISDFISENQLTETAYRTMNLFQRICQLRYPIFLAQDVNSEWINQIFILYIIPKANRLDISISDELQDCLWAFEKFLKKEHNIIFSSHKIFHQLNRVLFVYKEFSNFLESPVLSFSPLVIDLSKYKKSKARKNNSKIERLEKGYFEIADLLSRSNVLIRSIQSGRYFKLSLNKVLFCHIEQNDILNLVIRQKPYMGWEVQEIKAYYSNPQKNLDILPHLHVFKENIITQKKH